MMKAVICTQYGSPEVLQVTHIEKPSPKSDEVLVKIHATTVTAADHRVRSFNVPTSFWLPARLMLGLLKPRKSILGMELSGEVESCGTAVKKFEKGDKVIAASLQSFGAYAEYICLPENGPIALKPSNISYEEAAAIPIGARTAYHYLKTIADVKPAQKVLIYGASGSVGTYAVQLAKHFGAEVTGVCSTTNLALVRSLGADKVLDYTTEGFSENFETYDIIFITIDKCSFPDCKNALSKDAFYLNIGRPIPSLQMIWTSITSNKKIVVGKNSPETVEVLNVLKNLIERGHFKPVVDRNYTLDQIVEAHRYVDKGHKKGNVVITVNQATDK
ncbi:MAG: NAD(P)-dependent alcohol dehydrogenase [Cyclobacteriaceae bacterium]